MKTFKSFGSALLVGALLSGCSLTEVENPNITDVSFIGTPQSTQVWVAGMSKQLSLMLNTTVVYSEIVSDNYNNNSSLTNQVFDIPSLLTSDMDIDNMQRGIAKLTQMSEYGIAQVVPADKDATSAMKAQIYFMGGYGYLIGGELCKGLPITPGGVVGTAADRYKKAIQYFNLALGLETDQTKKNVYTLALARTYYDLGDKDNALLHANAVITSAPLLLQNAIYDGVNGVSNTMQTYTFSNSTNVLAPLPRLDFLDPKFYHTGNATSDQKPIAILKGEEAFLIAAEVALSKADLVTAKTLLKNLITDVIAKRPRAAVDGKLAVRKGTRSDYPLLATVKVKADASSPERSGLVLDRQAGLISVYTVSGTSVTAAAIDAAATVDALLYLLCQIRQEVFISEGRRMTDLGIRFPVSGIEQQNNPNVTAEFTLATIPDYIPLNKGMDDFTYDRAAGVVTVKNDMNKVLVQHKTAAGILPMMK
jgi:tetratricopeptide (TPR) repeat protein